MALDLDEIARRQLADYDARRPGAIFSDPDFHLTLAEAYEAQMRVAALREGRGERVAGYKVGCASDAIQKQLGIHEPVFGHIFEEEVHHSGVSLDAARYDGLAVEGEFALRLGENCEAASGFGVIELHHYVFRSPSGASAEELVANNAMQAGVVLPTDESGCGDITVLAAETIAVARNGGPLGTASCSAMTGGPLASLAWLVGRLERFGKRLRKGHLVLTGSPLPIYRVEPGDRIEVVCGRLPAVSMLLRPLGIRRQI